MLEIYTSYQENPVNDVLKYTVLGFLLCLWKPHKMQMALSNILLVIQDQDGRCASDLMGKSGEKAVPVHMLDSLLGPEQDKDLEARLNFPGKWES